MSLSTPQFESERGSHCHLAPRPFPPLLSGSCVCEAALCKSFDRDEGVGLSVPVIRMNVLSMVEDAALLSGLSLNLPVTFYSSCFHTSEERRLGEPGAQETWVKNHCYCMACSRYDFFMCYGTSCY